MNNKWQMIRTYNIKNKRRIYEYGKLSIKLIIEMLSEAVKEVETFSINWLGMRPLHGILAL